jgi:REP element-mobilizing transposase RayT
VLNRGIERRTIFPTRRCNERFIELLSSLPERFGVQLHAYALMGNHYHLPLESREANLSQAMHWLNVSCSVWFNRKYTRVGPLFQGRFKAILHETTAALMINRYIHLNPVRIAAQGRHENGGIASQDISEDLACRRVDALEQYCWSSYAFFAGERPAPNGYVPKRSWRSSAIVRNGSNKKRFGDSCRKRQLQDLGKPRKAKVRHTIFLGSGEFVARMRKLLRGRRDPTGSS